jgi:UPF0755 protein
MTKAAKKRPRRTGRRLFALLVLALLGAGLGSAWAWHSLHTPRGEGNRSFVVQPGQGAAAILAGLEREGFVPDARIARLYLMGYLGNPPLKAGDYEFEGPVSAVEAIKKVARGEVTVRSVTIREGLTLEETAEALLTAGFGRRGALLEALRDPAPIRDLDPDARDLEGYLFPETYSWSRGTGEREIVATLVATFRERFEREVRVPYEAGRAAAFARSPLHADAAVLDAAAENELAPNQPPTPRSKADHHWRTRSIRELVTLASIVEMEAQLQGERRLIAGVYANRMALGMGLYADPTVIFALKRVGRWDGNIRKSDLQIDSPYNTYRYAGLPPGPIASPGLASLKAAADPSSLNYLYFVSRNDGSHIFASTLAEHNRNVDRWQRRYWREKWAEEGGK